MSELFTTEIRQTVIVLRELREDRNMGKYFGTDGFRGEANRTLTVEHAFKIGQMCIRDRASDALMAEQ